MPNVQAPYCFFVIALFASIAKAKDIKQPDIPETCQGTPSDAVMRLPGRLNDWGQIICSPYGHVILAKAGWVWSYPGSYAPVWLPAQMVKQDPQPLGNTAYFKKIDLTLVKGKEAEIPFNAFRKHFPNESPPDTTYRLDLLSSSGKSLRLFFLDYERPWGIWCPDGVCDPSSAFMILNMAAQH